MRFLIINQLSDATTTLSISESGSSEVQTQLSSFPPPVLISHNNILQLAGLSALKVASAYMLWFRTVGIGHVLSGLQITVMNLFKSSVKIDQGE